MNNGQKDLQTKEIDFESPCTTFECCVWAMEFGVGLLEERRPELIELPAPQVDQPTVSADKKANDK